MSQNECVFGFFSKSDLNITPEDTDDFYDLEKEHDCHFVKVAGQLYSFHITENLDAYGFGQVIEMPERGTAFAALWYNGGAGIHEVVESIIERHQKEGQQ